MWYIIIVALSVCGNCWAMHRDGHITVYKDKPVTMGNGRNISDKRDILFNIAKEYHEERLATEETDATSLYAGCVDYLKKHKDTVALALSQNGNVVLHGFENKLVAIDYTTKKPAEIIEPISPEGQALNAELTFVSCSAWFDCTWPSEWRSGWRYMAVDNARKIHAWKMDCSPGVDGRYADDWKKTVPGTVTAIRQINNATAAIFYQDDHNIDRVGITLSRRDTLIDKEYVWRNVFVPIEDAKNVTHVQIGYEVAGAGKVSELCKIFSADGSFVIYEIVKDDEGLKRIKLSTCSIQ